MKGLFSFGFVLLVSFLVHNVQAYTDAEKSAIAAKVETMKTFGRQCAMEFPITLTQFKGFQKKEVPEGKNTKCFTACMFKKVGIMDEAGMISSAGARKNAEQVFAGNEEYLKNIDEIMKICSAVNEENTSDGEKGCDRAKLAFKCFMENAPKYGFNLDV